MSRSWKLSLVFLSSLALGTFANAQLAVGAGARGQVLGSLNGNGNGFVTTGSLNADGTVHGGFNDGVRFAQPSPSTTETTAKPSKKAQRATAAAAGSATNASVNSGSQQVNASTTTTASASVRGSADTHR